MSSSLTQSRIRRADLCWTTLLEPIEPSKRSDFEEYQHSSNPGLHTDCQRTTLMMKYLQLAQSVDLSCLQKIVMSSGSYIISKIVTSNLWGNTSLHFLAQRKDSQLSFWEEMLAAPSADVNAVNKYGCSIMECYLFNNRKFDREIVMAMLRAGFDSKL